jgi:acyl-CoA thioesterase-1
MNMKKYILIFIISMVSLMANGATRIMPLGDSITFDDAYNPKPDRLKASYRSFLWYKLQDAGYQIDFVGSLKTGWDLRPSFDGDNEGHPGWTSYDIAGHIYGFLQRNPADIVLLMAGANDWSESVDGIESTLDEIDRYESNYHHHIKVILARIPNREGHSQDWMSNFNRNLQNMANWRVSNGDDIYVIDLEYGAGIDYDHDFQDPTHPNDTAYRKIANVWYDALKRVLPKPIKTSFLPAVYSILLN